MYMPNILTKMICMWEEQAMFNWLNNPLQSP